MTLSVYTLPVTSLQQNCRILGDHGSGKALLVDPGGEGEKILSQLDELNLSPSEVWLTHSHLDHCGGVAAVLEKFDIPLLAHPEEREMRRMVEEIARLYGIPPEEMKNCPEPTQGITGGEQLTFGSARFEVRFCPGHSPGHVVFVCHEEGFVLGGDTLFAGSIGRTDLPGGDHELLLRGIQRELYTLPGEMRVLSGHGPDTTIARERETNPYVRGE